MKFKFFALALFVSLVVGCASSSASKNSDSAMVDSAAVEVSSEPQGMLNAFGLKGKVKTLNISDGRENGYSFTFAFDPQGNFIDNPDYNGGEVKITADDETVWCTLSINNWKWTKMNISSRWVPPTDYQMLAYDANNRPIEASILVNDEVVIKNVAITYSGSDSKGNYTHMKFAITGNQEDEPGFKLKLEYWPDSATIADLPKPLTESVAEDLIKKANRKEGEALTKDFKALLEKEDEIPCLYGDNGYYAFSEGYGTQTMLSDLENTNVPDIAVQISTIDMEDSGDKATVTFHYSPIWEGNYDKSYFDDNDYFWLVDCIYEDGKWKVDDFGRDIVYNNFHYYAGWSYKEDAKETMKYRLDDIRSGLLEKMIKEDLANDPEMNTYLKKVADFKKRHDIK